MPFPFDLTQAFFFQIPPFVFPDGDLDFPVIACLALNIIAHDFYASLKKWQRFSSVTPVFPVICCVLPLGIWTPDLAAP